MEVSTLLYIVIAIIAIAAGIANRYNRYIMDQVGNGLGWRNNESWGIDDSKQKFNE